MCVPIGCHVLPVDENSSRGRRLEARQHAQQGRLATARAAEQTEDFALENAERDVVDRDEITKSFGDALDPNVLLTPVDGLLRHALPPAVKTARRMSLRAVRFFSYPP